MTTVVLASTLFGAATAVTALDNERATGPRLLVVANNASQAEIVPDLTAIEGFEALADRFDRIVSLNALIAPFHPSEWRPPPEDLLIIERLVRDSWDIGGGQIRLFLESIQVRPAQTLAGLFPDAPITVYADGLMSYSPTRNALLPDVFTRIERLVLPDLVPGVHPLALGEYGVPVEVFPIEMLGKTLASMATESPVATDPPISESQLAADGERLGLIVGQYLGALGVLSPGAERDLHIRMLAAAHRLGMTRVLFKPHPNSPPALMGPLQTWAGEHGLDFHAVTSRALVETLLDRVRPALVVSAFSTALVTARRLYGAPCVSVGASELLRRLRPFPNSNRIPLVIVNATTPDGETVGAEELAAWEPVDPTALTELVRAVGYVMQPERRRDLRPSVDRLVARGDLDLEELGASRARVTRLGLPGGFPGGTLAYRLDAAPPGRLARKALSKVRRASTPR